MSRITLMMSRNLATVLKISIIHKFKRIIIIVSLAGFRIYWRYYLSRMKKMRNKKRKKGTLRKNKIIRLKIVIIIRNQNIWSQLKRNSSYRIYPIVNHHRGRRQNKDLTILIERMDSQMRKSHLINKTNLYKKQKRLKKYSSLNKQKKCLILKKKQKDRKKII